MSDSTPPGRQTGEATGTRFLGGLTLGELLRRVGHELTGDDVLGRSAQLSYYFLLSVFPVILVLATLVGFLQQGGSDLLNKALGYIGQVAPPTAFKLVLSTVKEIGAGAGAGKLSLGILGTLWSASMGVGAIMNGLNAAYEVEEGRPWWKAQAVAIGLTLALGAFVLIALAAILYGGRAGSFLSGEVGMERWWVMFWNVARWPLSVLVVLASLMIVYRFAPDLHHQRWIRTVPGAIVALCLWFVASLGFRTYLRFFDTYNPTYGSLGAVIILLLWFYLTGAALLIGGEVNSEIENAAAKAGDPDAKLPGEKSPSGGKTS